MAQPQSPRTASEALAWANARTSFQTGMCLSFCRQAWGLPGGTPDAITAWNRAQRQHPARADDPPPPGAPVFYRGGQHGHITLNQPPARLIRTTDAPSSGRVSDQDYTWPTNRWGYPVLGWTEDLNGHLLRFDMGGGSGTDDGGLDVDEATLRAIVSQETANSIRQEGASGGGDQGLWEPVVRAWVQDEVTKCLRSEGVTGAGDPAVNGTQTILDALAAG